MGISTDCEIRNKEHGTRDDGSGAERYGEGGMCIWI